MRGDRRPGCGFKNLLYVRLIFPDQISYLINHSCVTTGMGDKNTTGIDIIPILQPVFHISRDDVVNVSVIFFARMHGAVQNLNAGLDVQQIRTQRRCGRTSTALVKAVTSPYALFLADGRYCVLASVSGYGRLLHFRCDFMRQTRVLDVPVRDASELAECRDGLDVIGYVDPEATVNVIREGELSEKKQIGMPERLTNVLFCKNPRCITSCEQEIEHVFRLSDRGKKEYRCIWCETKAAEL